MNLSVDHNVGNYGAANNSNQVTPNTMGGHNKHISMNGLPYEKNNRLTPVNQGGNNKAVTQMKNYDETDNLRQQNPNSNSRNNHVRMPSLPNNIKGSIGSSGPGNFS